jgi:catalase-peroxidase
MSEEIKSGDISKCPFHGAMNNRGISGSGTGIRDWWPDQLNLGILRRHSSLSDPMDEGFDYAAAFKALDLEAIKKDRTS